MCGLRLVAMLSARVKCGACAVSVCAHDVHLFVYLTRVYFMCCVFVPV